MELKSTVLSGDAIEFIKENGVWRDILEYPGDISDKELPCIIYYSNPNDVDEIQYIAYLYENLFTISGMYTKITMIDGEVIDRPICLHKFKLTSGDEAHEVIQGISEDGYILLGFKINGDGDLLCGFKV